MRILGVTASSYGEYTSFESIATVTSSGSSSTLTFSSISSAYTHLQIRCLYQIATGGNEDTDFVIRFNSDTGSNYTKHQLYGDGSSVAATGTANTTSIPGGVSYNSSANAFNVAIIDILDYGNTNKYKTVRVLTGRENNTNGSVFFRSGVWRNTNAVTTIDLVSSANNFNNYTQFALYGIKGA